MRKSFEPLPSSLGSDALSSADVGAEVCLTLIVIGTPTAPGDDCCCCCDDDDDDEDSGRRGSTTVEGVSSYVREELELLTERVTVVELPRVDERRNVEANVVFALIDGKDSVGGVKINRFDMARESGVADDPSFQLEKQASRLST
jgi:hypothetical protein